MLSKTHVSKSLDSLKELFAKAKGNTKPQFYAKLALMEACGFIEECIDDIVKSLSNSKLAVVANRNNYESDVIKRTSGFEYTNYLRNKLLRNLIGIILIEKIEVAIAGTATFLAMKASLNTLSINRNDNAHTHISGTTPSIMAPTVTISHFDNVYVGLKQLDKELKRLKFK